MSFVEFRKFVLRSFVFEKVAEKFTKNSGLQSSTRCFQKYSVFKAPVQDFVIIRFEMQFFFGKSQKLPISVDDSVSFWRLKSSRNCLVEFRKCWKMGRNVHKATIFGF